MMYDENNIFAKILRKEIPTQIILENEHAAAFKDIAPRAQVHVLVIPKKKYIKFNDFIENASKDVLHYFFELINDLIKKFQLVKTGYRIITNGGNDGNQEVPHLHFHLLGGQNLGPM